MKITITVDEIFYSIKHLPNQEEFMKEHPRKGRSWEEVKEMYVENYQDAKKAFIEAKAKEIFRFNMRAEAACKDRKESTLKLLIITKIV